MSFNDLLLRMVRQIASFQFGVRGEELFPDNCFVEVSPSTGKPRRIWLDGKVLATVRPADGMLALTYYGGLRLVKLINDMMHKVVVDDEGASLVRKGFDVDCINVSDAYDKIVAGQEVLVVDREHNLVGVGKAVLTGLEMKRFKKGVAVKIRHKE